MKDSIFQRLTQDHDMLRDMMEELAATEGDTPQRRALFGSLAQELIYHAKAEERTLYQFMLGNERVQDVASHSIHEHEQIEDAIAEVHEIEMSSPQWLIRFKKLKELVEHHLDEEEQDIFDSGEDLISADLQQELGMRYMTEKHKENQKHYEVA